MLYYIDNNAQLTFFSILSCNVTIQHYEKHVGIGKVVLSSLPLFVYSFFLLFFFNWRKGPIYREIYRRNVIEQDYRSQRTKKSN